MQKLELITPNGNGCTIHEQPEIDTNNISKQTATMSQKLLTGDFLTKRGELESGIEEKGEVVIECKM